MFSVLFALVHLIFFIHIGCDEEYYNIYYFNFHSPHHFLYLNRCQGFHHFECFLAHSYRPLFMYFSQILLLYKLDTPVKRSSLWFINNTILPWVACRPLDDNRGTGGGRKKQAVYAGVKKVQNMGVGLCRPA